MVKLLPFLLITFCLSQKFNVEGRRERSIIEDEDLEFERQLKIINKPANITIQTDTGDIYACVDIQHQPALDHPKLRNHKVQLRPESLPKEFLDSTPSTNTYKKATLQRVDCPEGTVPIKRVGKEELRAAKRFSESLLLESNEAQPQSSEHPGTYQVVAKLGHGDYRGIKAALTLEGLEILADHWVTSQVWISEDPNGYTNHLWAGWMTDRNHQCFNAHCGGFVATSKSLAVGAAFEHLSEYGGDQYYIDVLIAQEESTGNWWLRIGENNEPVGYWPKGVVPAIDDGASYVMWGGITSGPVSEDSSPLGNGNFPTSPSEVTKTCLTAFMKIVDSQHRLIDAPKSLEYKVDCEANYHLQAYGGDKWRGTAILFGGPGGPCS
ncbi:hypothetical protein Scep_026805 [Stephania cephalantha]|uniref:Neprosin PEP catalytic domain-containing protein n=1 Tax=Stephania cephalantha TaxID=152367 RepID=A0AAP0EL03_9MAGN